MPHYHPKASMLIKYLYDMCNNLKILVTILYVYYGQN